MEQSEGMWRHIGQLVLALLLVSMSGCAIFAPEPVPEPVVEVPVAEPPPEPVVPEPRPEPAPPPVVVIPETFAAPVAVVVTSQQPAYAGVAAELSSVLEDHSLYDLSDRSQSVRQVFEKIEAEKATAVVAIGLRAALVAKNLSQVPVVFCQVFNIEDNELVADQRKGIASIPPLDMQLKAWLEIDPDLKNIGAILGEGHDALIDEAMAAATAAGVKLHYRVVGSDRETLYVFNRLIPDIDGFLLFPDNRVLSRDVLREMLNYASRHRVQVAMFNDSLLPLGGTFSASAVSSDIAASVVVVLDKLARGEGGAVPDISPLHEIQIHTNDALVRQYGLIDTGIDTQDTVADAL